MCTALLTMIVGTISKTFVEELQAVVKFGFGGSYSRISQDATQSRGLFSTSRRAEKALE